MATADIKGYGGWKAEVHVYPVKDLREHKLEEPCWCEPTFDAEKEVVIHHAADQREKYETGERKPS